MLSIHAAAAVVAFLCCWLCYGSCRDAAVFCCFALQAQQLTTVACKLAAPHTCIALNPILLMLLLLLLPSSAV
jgi:hypothetical protein